LGKEKNMKTLCLLVIVLVAAVACARPSVYSARFTVTTVIPAGLADARREAWKVERMFGSARFRDIATGSDARLSASSIQLNLSVDRKNQRLEISTSAASEDLAFRAARAYAKAATQVLNDGRAEFEILSGANVEAGPVRNPSPR
jgi:hypothetical protein